MIQYIPYLLVTVILMIATGAAVFFIQRFLERSRKQDAKTLAEETIRQAKLKADNFRREAELEIKEKEIKQKERLEEQARKSRQEQVERERQLEKRQDGLDKRDEELRKQQKNLENTQRKLSEKIAYHDSRNAQLDKVYSEQEAKLCEISGLTKEEATQKLLDDLETTLGDRAGSIILKHERYVTERCQEQARNILLLAMQRYAATYPAESTTAMVDIPSDDMKGRIIGREGRNIRTFQKATGCEIVVDDTPGAVMVGSFSPVRREIGVQTLKRLIADGRIQPARIEEIAVEAEQEIEDFIRHTGFEAVEEVDVHGLNEQLIYHLGELHFRTSFSQNVLRHSMEVAFIAGMIATEIGLDERLARRCGLLHDIGKAIDHEIEGAHPNIGADLLRRFHEPPEVVHAALGHHAAPKIDYPYTVLVAAADACSASRPGARRDTIEHYIKRMEELEAIANEYPEVEQSYAVRAGREIRVLVHSNKTTDESAAKICRDIVERLTKEIQFPGEIKVTVIRETRTTGIAK